MHLKLSASPQFINAQAQAVVLSSRDGILLAWLALEGPTPRGRLAQLLWPDSAADAARNALRQRLHHLRKQCGVALVEGTGVLALADGVAHDLDDSDGVLGETREGLGAELVSWLEHQRQRRQSRVRQSLAELADMAEQAGDLEDALGHAKELLVLEPLSEEAHRRVMRLHYLRGDRAAALLAFDRCEQVLKDEIGARPSAPTMALLSTLERSDPVGGRTRPAGVPASVLRPPRLVGRERERIALHTAWDDQQPAVVTGDGGLGKSRLLNDFAAERGGTLVMSARPGDERVVYASFSRLLRLLPFARLAALEPSLRDELAQLLPELGTPKPMRDRAARTRFFNAVCATLDHPSLGIAGVVVDDLHFADAASIELLHYAAGATRCRWAVAARPAEVGDTGREWLDALSSLPQAARVALQPLDVDAIGELVDSLGIDGLHGADTAPALLRHTGGNPLFLLETIKAWLTQGESAWPVRLPAVAGVSALIERRIGQLSPTAVQLARCAAVAAPDFSIELASQVLGLRTLALSDPWAELERAQVLRDGAFAHDLIYEAALASVPQPVARQLHAEIAAFLADHDGEPARLAAHWARAERWRQAAEAWMRAAARSEDAGRSVEHTQLLAQAADAFGRCGDGAGRFDALLRRATVLAGNDVGEAARAAVDELEAAAQTELQRLHALGVRLDLAIIRFEIDEALQLAPQAVQKARALGLHALDLRFSIAWSGALGDARRMAEGVKVLEPLAAWVKQHAGHDDQWAYWEAMSLALDYAGRLRESTDGWQACEALARQHGRPDWLWRSLSNGAAGQAKRGRVLQACEMSEQARQIVLSTGEVGRLRLLQMQAPHAHRLRDVGRYAEALPLLEESLDGFLAGGSATDIAMTEQRLAVLFLYLGQPARSQRLLATERTGLPPGVLQFRRVLQAEVTHVLGGDAEAAIREALALVPNPDDVFHRIATLFASHIVPAAEGEAMASSLATWAASQERFGLAMTGHVRAAGCAAAQGAWQRALPHAQAALGLVADYQPETFYLGELWWQVGRVYEMLGRVPEAREVVAAGRAWVRRLHDEQVPAEFRTSFLERNPANRELMALAARLTP